MNTVYKSTSSRVVRPLIYFFFCINFKPFHKKKICVCNRSPKKCMFFLTTSLKKKKTTCVQCDTVFAKKRRKKQKTNNNPKKLIIKTYTILERVYTVNKRGHAQRGQAERISIGRDFFFFYKVYQIFAQYVEHYSII